MPTSFCFERVDWEILQYFQIFNCNEVFQRTPRIIPNAPWPGHNQRWGFFATVRIVRVEEPWFCIKFVLFLTLRISRRRNVLQSSGFVSGTSHFLLESCKFAELYFQTTLHLWWHNRTLYPALATFLSIQVPRYDTMLRKTHSCSKYENQWCAWPQI